MIKDTNNLPYYGIYLTFFFNLEPVMPLSGKTCILRTLTQVQISIEMYFSTSLNM